MRLAFLDESETADGGYYITALCIGADRAQGLEWALDDVVRWAMKEHRVGHLDSELHAIDLVGGQRDWADLRPSAKIPTRIAIFEKALVAIAASGAGAYIRGADLATHARRYRSGTEVHATVLPWVLERVQDDAAAHDDVALVIADERARADRYRKEVGYYRRYGTSGWKATKLDRLVDTIHFAPSKFSRLLQAADLVSYTNAMQHKKHSNEATAAAWAQAWTIVQPAIREMTCWFG